MAVTYNTSGPFIWDDLVTASGATQKYPKGTRRDEDGKTYRYCLYNNGTGNIASFAGAVGYIKAAATDPWEITIDVSDTDQNQVRGVMLGVVTDAHYFWLQTAGYYATVKTNADDDIAAHVSLFGVGDGTCDSMAADTASTNKVLGYATAADVDANDTVAAILTLD